MTQKSPESYRNHIDFFFFDFDSTLIQTEGLEVLAEVVLENRADKTQVLNEIQEICNLGMEGKIDFKTSLASRLELFQPSLKHIDRAVEIMSHQITKSVKNNLKFFELNRENIYVISGGFADWILPITDMLKIKRENVLANKFVFENGVYAGFDTTNPLAGNQGKVRCMRSLGLKGRKWIIGDGYTDFEIKREGEADFFVAFVENTHRANVVAQADFVVKSIDDLWGIIESEKK